MFSTLSKREIIIYGTFILSSANAFNSDKVKFLSSGNGLSFNKSANENGWWTKVEFRLFFPSQY